MQTSKIESPLLMHRYIGNGDGSATVANLCLIGDGFFASVTDEGLHISDRVGDTDPFSVSEGVFGPFPMCRSVLVWMPRTNWTR